jgi:hypothetical protein
VLGASVIYFSPASVGAVLIIFFTISLFAISLAASPASPPADLFLVPVLLDAADPRHGGPAAG